MNTPSYISYMNLIARDQSLVLKSSFSQNYGQFIGSFVRETSHIERDTAEPDSTGYDCFKVSLGTWLENSELELIVGVLPFSEDSPYYQTSIHLVRGEVDTTLFNQGVVNSTRQQVILWAREKARQWKNDMDWMMELGYNVVEPVFNGSDYILFRRLSSGALYMSVENNFVRMHLRDLTSGSARVTSTLLSKREFPFSCLRSGVIEYEKELYTVEESPYMLNTLKRALVEV